MPGSVGDRRQLIRRHGLPCAIDDEDDLSELAILRDGAAAHLFS
ncbi:MAG: hypothetical protein ACR2ID_12220 [Chthoniobacterales bacterium]